MEAIAVDLQDIESWQGIPALVRREAQRDDCRVSIWNLLGTVGEEYQDAPVVGVSKFYTADFLNYWTGNVLTSMGPSTYNVPARDISKADMDKVRQKWTRAFPQEPIPDFKDPETLNMLNAWGNIYASPSTFGSCVMNPQVFGDPGLIIQSDIAPTSKCDLSMKPMTEDGKVRRKMGFVQPVKDLAHDSGISVIIVPRDTRSDNLNQYFPDQPAFLLEHGVTDNMVVGKVQDALDTWRNGQQVICDIGLEIGLYPE